MRQGQYNISQKAKKYYGVLSIFSFLVLFFMHIYLTAPISSVMFLLLRFGTIHRWRWLFCYFLEYFFIFNFIFSGYFYGYFQLSDLSSNFTRPILCISWFLLIEISVVTKLFISISRKRNKSYSVVVIECKCKICDSNVFLRELNATQSDLLHQLSVKDSSDMILPRIHQSFIVEKVYCLLSIVNWGL